jgi:hypothetical protein
LQLVVLPETTEIEAVEDFEVSATLVAETVYEPGFAGAV